MQHVQPGNSVEEKIMRIKACSCSVGLLAKALTDKSVRSPGQPERADSLCWLRDSSNELH